METFEIYTLGSGYYLEKIFNALRIIMIEDSSYTSTIKTACLGALVVLAIRAGINNDFKSAVKWFLGVATLVGLFLTTKATVVIQDKLPNSYGMLQAARTVQNVPWGLAVIGSITSQIGNKIAENFESSLSGAFNNSDYQKTGILFGSKIVEDTSKLRVSDPKLKQNILKFYKKCMVPDLNMGYLRKNGYTVKDLSEAPNILEFLKDHSSKARLIYIDGSMPKSETTTGMLGEKTSYSSEMINKYISCQQAATYLYNAFNFEADKRIPKLARSFMSYFSQSSSSNAGNSNNDVAFKNILAGSYGIFIKQASIEAKDILLQNMAINAIGDAVDSKVYGITLTESTSKLAYYSVAQMAQKFVPIFRAVLECLFYGVFPIILMLMVTPIGLEVLKNYTFGFIYLQLWQPMYAILFCIASSWGKLYASNIENITFATHGQIAHINEEISAVAGYMLTLVPVLSLFITKGMVASIGNLTSSIAYIPQTSAVQNAESAIKGNYQIGTSSVNTHSSNISSHNKHDDNYAWASGMQSFSMSSGAKEQIFGDGRVGLDSSGAVNNTAGLVDIDWNKSIGSRLDQSINDNVSKAEHHASRSLDSATSGYSTLLGYDKNFAQGSSSYNDWRNGLTSEQRSSLDEARSYVDRYAATHGINQQDALKLAVAANGGFSGKLMGAALSAKGSVNASTEASKNKSHNTSLESIKNENFTEVLQSVKNISQADTFQNSYSANNSMLDGIRSNFDQSRSASLEASKSFDQARTLQEAKSSYENNSANINQKLNSIFVEKQIEAQGVSGLDNMLRNNPHQSRAHVNQFIDQMLLSEARGVKDEFAYQKENFNQVVKSSVNNEYNQKSQLVGDIHKSNERQIIQVMPEEFETNIANKLDNSMQNSVTENIEKDNSYLIEKSNSLQKEHAKFQDQVNKKSKQGATKTLIDAWNPFHKDEN